MSARNLAFANTWEAWNRCKSAIHASGFWTSSLHSCCVTHETESGDFLLLHLSEFLYDSELILV